MRVVVTGSAGFVGRHTMAAFIHAGNTVIGFDRASGLALDLMDEDTVQAIAGWSPDVIVHLASSVSTPGSIASPVETFRDTVCTAVTVFEAARRSDAAVLVTSSVKARDGKTPYGAAKRMVETWAQEYCSAYRIPVVIDRPGTIYGPGQEGSLESGWIAWFLKAKAQGLPVVINGSGGQRRDLLHVYDYVALMMQQVDDHILGKGPRWDGRIFDIGGGQKNTMTVQAMAEYLGLEYTFGPPRYGDADVYVGLDAYPDWSPAIHWKDAEVFREWAPRPS